MRIINQPESQENIKEKDNCKSICFIDKDLVTLLVNQLSNELYNHNLYSSFASYFSNLGLEKIAEYYTSRATEEYIHHSWIFNYLISVNADFKYPSIKEIDEDLSNSFELTVKVEKETTKLIDEIVKKAKELDDNITLTFLYGSGFVEGHLVSEQNEELKLSYDILNIVKCGNGDWLAIQDAIYTRYYEKE